MNYKPYSAEWNRKRYLKESIDRYFDDYADNAVIYSDILDILAERSEKAYQEFQKVNQLEHMFNRAKTS